MPPRDRRSRKVPDNARLLQLADRADIDDRRVQQLLARGLASNDAHLRRQVADRLAGKAVEQQVDPFAAHPPTPSVDPAGIRLGTTPTGTRYTLREDALTQHLLAVGRTGAGKTTLMYNLMDQVSVPFWSFDLKQDYRHLIHDDSDLLVLPWRRLKFNPLKPPAGVPPRRWAQVFSEIFGHATDLLSGSKNFLMEQLIELYRLYGLFEQVAEPYPSLIELQLLVEHAPINYVRKLSNYRDTVQNRLNAMTLTAGTVFACSTGYPIEDLLDRNIVFEFDGLHTDVQNFLMEILFAAVYEYRVARNQRGGDLRHVFFLDEGKRVFSVYKERQDAAGIPKIDELTAKMREFGEGLVVADQEATKLTDSIKANTATKVLFATGDTKQFAAIADVMNLSEREAVLAQQAAVGEAVVQTAGSNPVPVKLTHYELEKTVTDRELRDELRKTWNRLSYTDHEQVPAFIEQVGQNDEDSVAVDVPADPGTRDIDISPAAETLLRDIVESPFTPPTERYDQFSSRGKGTRAKRELVENGLIEERTVGTEPRKLFQLTRGGREYVEQLDGLELERRGRGGIEHQYYQHRLKELIEEVGWPAVREAFDADVYVNMDDLELAIEVAMADKQREIEHIDAHLDAFDYVWVFCKDVAVREGLEERLADAGLPTDRVTFRLVTDIEDGLELPASAGE